MATTEPSPSTVSPTTLRQRLTPGSILTGVCILVGIGLMVSNPSRSAYTDYAASRLRDRIQVQCDTLKGNLQAFIFSIPLQEVCEITAPGVGVAATKTLGPVVDQFTEPRKYYVLFSIYTTDVPLIGHFKTLAIAGQFITWESESTQS